ncbi:mannose-6-phosphate isomerase, class I [Corynebacterium tapiri]|uniref:mannose-6-phosphate isomerase n=1 Tax=Corynebacterium tapiri TaxID=1448266 RepID=A0A5C4U3X9_9CORY|nr:mannose-6-phosphate isomerase, class I [Corynebacterium tapiri]TNL98423.1 mannose-6-phosphate isomerase, class I [Corynebacterium tapiri]
MQHLHGALRYYPWGSRTMLAKLRGIEEPSQRPEAEMWFGAHPAAPAQVDGVDLTDIIARDPEGELGAPIIERFGERLPFLVKLLAADQPLSLQAHPSLEQAREGFARENEAGLPLDAPNRNYRDASHKPEVIIALTSFQALTGFRPLDKTRELFDVLACPKLSHYADILDGHTAEDSAENGDLRALFTTWLTIPATTRSELIDSIVEAAQAHLDRDDWIGDTLRVVVDLNERYPGDPGVLGALLLNLVTLEPGEAVYTEAGQLHAYVHGLGVEVMANSDNVLRGGLTPKHVDVPELVRVLRFEETIDPRVAVHSDGTVDAPAAEFRVQRVDLQPNESLTVAEDGPVIVLCVAGELSGAQAAEALWISAQESATELTAGPEGAQAFKVTV